MGIGRSKPSGLPNIGILLECPKSPELVGTYIKLSPAEAGPFVTKRLSSFVADETNQDFPNRPALDS
jgi:hypothetical protein